MARKRVIYAHSDILIRRSEYFQTMLTSSFSENVSVPSGDRKIYEIIVEEADFVTIYWYDIWTTDSVCFYGDSLYLVSPGY